MNRIGTFGRSTFSSLAVRNYRLYATGQGISLSGTWMQTIAQGLLVLRLTGSGTSLGLVTALQTLPVLLFGPWGGLVADRFAKRSILYVTQASAGLLALTLGLLVATDQIRIWMVYVLAFGLGMVNAVDNPTRQTFVVEMVGRDRLANAISLNSTEINLARVIGPSIAGLLVATVGLAACFILNGLSYIGVLASLAMMRSEELQPTPRLARARGQLGEALRYVKRTPVLLSTLLMMTIVGMFTYEFTISLPLLAEFTFDNGAGAYAAMSACMGFGAVIGGLVTASRRISGPRVVYTGALFFGLSVIAVALSPTLLVALIALVVVGYFSITFTSTGNVTVQMNSAPEMRGRIMALWTMAFLGSTPIGGPIIGAIGEHVGARWSLLVGGAAAVIAAGLGAWQMRRNEERRADVVSSFAGASATSIEPVRADCGSRSVS